MRTLPWFRFAAALAAGSLMLPPMAQAQGDTAPSAATAQDAAGAAPQNADLPSRVGRLARLSGTVSFHTADEDHWDPATLNYPVTTGDAFWTEPQATASIEVAASRIDLASSTEFDIEQLDDHALAATQAQGETFLDLRDLQPNETVTIRTPRGSVAIAGDGQYELVAGDTQTPTTITVLAGAAQVSGEHLALSVQAGQAATITGSGGSGDGFAGVVAPAAERDAFLTAELAAAASASAPASVAAQASVTARATATASASVSAAAPAVVRQMPGGSDLSSYGDWQGSAQYGQVWYPRVQQDWVPYRQGHWAYVAPWGWTWIDDEAWGYAPFHYGRWVRVADRWGWAPVYYAPGYAVPAFWRPVYAPALVGFFGFGAGLAAGLAIGGGVGFGFGLGFGGFGYGHIGWCPLGWGEPYRPWFHAGRGYFDRVNHDDVANIHNVTYNNSVHDVTINNYANAARGATVVPTTAMLNAQRAASVAQPFSRANFSEAHPISTVPRPAVGTPSASRAAPGPRVSADPRAALALRPSDHGAASRAASMSGSAASRAAPVSGSAAYRAAPVSDRAATATHGGLPPLRTAGATPRATRGAPGPAFTPRPTAAAARRAFAANAAVHAAPGPAIGRGAVAGSLAAHTALPDLRLHAVGVRSSAQPHFYGAAAARPSGGQAGSPSPHVQPPQRVSPVQRYQPAAHPVTPAPRYQAPQARYEAPRYQAPQPRYEAPRYQAPQTRYAAPRYQAPQPRYEAPRYQAPARQFAAPAARPAPGGRRPWPP